MDFQEVLRNRYSCRYFSDQLVSLDVLKDIVADAQRAPSWVNAQEWRVWIATGKTLEAIRQEYSYKTTHGIKGYSDFPVVHRDQWSAMAQENMKQFSDARVAAGLLEIKEASQQELFHAPAVAFLTLNSRDNLWSILDLGGFQQTLLLAAADRGIASVPAYNLVKYPDVLRKHLGISEDAVIAIGIALGYPLDCALTRHRSVRRPVDDILTIRS